MNSVLYYNNYNYNIKTTTKKHFTSGGGDGALRKKLTLPCFLFRFRAIISGACAQQPLMNITWSQLDGVTELPNGDVILGRVADQTDDFCVANLEVGRVYLMILILFKF